MGKGDKKTRRGKINQGSYGKKRAKNKKSVAAIPVKVLTDPDPKGKVKTDKVTKEKSEVAKKPAGIDEKPKTTRKKKTEE